MIKINLKKKMNKEVRVESYLHAQIGRRLADDRLSSSDIATDQEDSPLQSKRSSMCNLKFTLISLCCINFCIRLQLTGKVSTFDRLIAGIACMLLTYLLTIIKIVLMFFF